MNRGAILELERALLAAMVLWPRECSDIPMQSCHLLAENHAALLDAIRGLESAGEPVDAITIGDYLERHAQPHLRGLAATLVAECPVTLAGAHTYARQLMQAWRLRRAAEIGEGLRGATEDAAVDAAITQLLELHAEDRRYEHTAPDMMRAANSELLRAVELQGRLPGIPSGLADLDEKLGGFHPGDLVVIGGRAAMGKTAFLLNASLAAATREYPIGIISAEQPVVQMGQRLIGLQAKVPVRLMRNAKLEDWQWPQVGDAVGRIAALRMHVYDRSSPTMAEIARVARKWKLKDEIGAIYVDYLQRLSGGEGERRHEQVGSNIRALKNLARELDIPVIVLSQVSRAVESRANQEPRMGDLSDSSEIEKEADQVLMLYRPDYYDHESPDKGKLKLIIEKNRHGPTGYIWCAWHADTMRVMDYYGEAA